MYKWWKVTEERFKKVEEKKKNNQERPTVYIDFETLPFKKTDDDTVKRLSAYHEALRKAMEKKNDKE